MRTSKKKKKMRECNERKCVKVKEKLWVDFAFLLPDCFMDICLFSQLLYSPPPACLPTYHAHSIPILHASFLFLDPWESGLLEGQDLACMRVHFFFSCLFPGRGVVSS